MSHPTKNAIIFVNRFFHPDHSATSQMLSDLAFALAERGHDVSVITSRLRYDAPEVQLLARETIKRVTVVRIWTSRFGRHTLVGRAVDYGTFYVATAWSLWRLAQRGDTVVAMTDPPMLGVLAGPIARWRGARQINWLQDIFPEVAEALGVGRGRLARLAYRFTRALRDRSLRRAVMNVALGTRMSEKLAMLGVARERVCMISNWADEAVLQPQDHSRNPVRITWGLERKFVVGYSGNLGRAHDYTTLLEAIAYLETLGRSAASQVASRDEEPVPSPMLAELPLEDETALPPDVVWLFIGGGAGFEAFKGAVRARALTTVFYQPYQPRELLSASLSAADVHLVSLKPELEGLIVPSKFYGITAVGRPTIFIGDKDGEIARLLQAHACGVTVEPGDAKGLSDAVLALARDQRRRVELGARARAACERHFGKLEAVAKWEGLLIDLEA